MTDWPEVRKQLDELLKLQAAEIDARLAEITRENPELGRDLASLVAHDRAARAGPGFLERPSTPPIAATARRVGPYELERELGRGGMGAVYLARRADGAFERRVAVKLIQHGVTDERVLERFRRERQVLANLEHPGIARLIEGGATDDGTPYLVMEHVEGVRIDQHCDNERLPVRARIELFLKVCDAVQHAHENLVVHRDLKPQNILVGANGDPKLLDFGIAKLLDPEKTSAAPEVTIGLARAMTPSYASPEQVAGRPITTASDVYSLGVVLYQLVTGALPYKVDTASAIEIERIVCEAEPTRPSTAVRQRGETDTATALRRMATARTLARTLSGDLDRILLKALRKEPRLRYASADKLAEDLRRHLAGLPVSAQADTTAYRLSKFVRRNRTGVAAAGLVLAALVGGLIVSWMQYRRAESARLAERDQRERAEEQGALAEERLAVSEELREELDQERQAAEGRVAEVERLNNELKAQRAIAERRFEEVHGFATKMILDLYTVLTPISGTTKAQEFVVGTGLAYLDRLAAEAEETDSKFRRELTQGYLRLSSVQGTWGRSNLGHLEAAERSLDKALAIATELVREEPDEIHNAMVLAQARSTLTILLRTTGRECRALEVVEEAVADCAWLEHHPDSQVGHLFVVYSTWVLLTDRLAGEVPPAETLAAWRRADELLVRIAEIWPDPAQILAETHLVRSAIANLEHRLGHTEVAAQRAQRAVEALEAIQLSTGDPLVGRRLVPARISWAELLVDRGDHERALRQLDANHEALESAITKDPDNVQAREDHVANAIAYTNTYRASKDLAKALEHSERGLSFARENAALAPRSAEIRLVLATLLREVSTIQRELGFHFEAGNKLSEGFEITEELLAADRCMSRARVERVRTTVELGRAHRAHRSGADGRSDLAVRALTSAVDWFELAKADAAELPHPDAWYPMVDVDAIDAELAECRAELGALRAATD